MTKQTAGSARKKAAKRERPSLETSTLGSGLATRLGNVLGRLIRLPTDGDPPSPAPRAEKGTRRPGASDSAARARKPRTAKPRVASEPAPASPGKSATPVAGASASGPSHEPVPPGSEPADPPLRLTGATKRFAETIEQTLAEFGTPVRVVHAETGPMLLRFGVLPGYLEKPARGDAAPRRERVRVARIVSRQHDLALALGVTSLRVEAPVPGKTYVGIEVPNPNPKPVPLPPLLDEPAFQALSERGVLPVALGRDVAGQPILADLARLPHLLIAGSTGSGKSVAVNSLLGAILRARGPVEARLIVVDPKRVEFTWLEGIPHLLAPVVTEPEKAVDVLGKVETEMAHRYDLLANAGCRNRLAYNAKQSRGGPPLPALVVVVDELADLMMLASEDVERSICRVAQLGRAAGIHLVVATQRPSVDVITGLIKANLPARLAFAVSSLVDSRTILDAPGAEKLLGRGDFLYLSPEAMKPVRGQGAMARDPWLEQVVAAARKAVPTGTPDPEAERFARLQSAAQIAEDKLYAGALQLAQEHPKVSASYLQRKLRIGYPKAVALIERLRADGVIADPELDDE
jgi:S-DNA-T family DNA segregation ATPase FtsK/SpoIIIE